MKSIFILLAALVCLGVCAPLQSQGTSAGAGGRCLYGAVRDPRMSKTMDMHPPLTAPGVPTVALFVQERRRSELLLFIGMLGLVPVLVIAGIALAIDQSPTNVVGGGPTLYVFYWPPSLQDLPDRPIGLFMLFVLLVVQQQGLLRHQPLLRGGALLLPLFGCVGWGIIHSLSSGANLKILIQEVWSLQYFNFFHIFL